MNKSSLKDNYEVIFGIDSDDINTIDYVNRLNADDLNFQIVILEPMGYRSLYNFHNKMAEISKGDIFWAFSDDIEVLSENWDLEILKHKDEIYMYISLGDLYDNNWPYSLYPIISRRWYETTGRISGNVHTDGWLGCIAYDLQLIKRIDVSCNLFMASTGKDHDDENLRTIHREEHLKDKKKIKELTNSIDIGEQLGFV
jgi:hypothetical protein